MTKTVKIIFISEGEKKEFNVPIGTTVLEAAHNNNINLEGACEGSLACSTCHVVVDKEFYVKLNQPTEDEEDMLDLAFGLTPTSRLGCQIVMTEELNGLTLTVPAETRNISLNKN
jgi:2Fe-2S ferredoxin